MLVFRYVASNISIFISYYNIIADLHLLFTEFLTHLYNVLILFRSDKTDDQELQNGDNILARWERQAYMYVKDEYHDPYIRLVTAVALLLFIKFYNS